MLFWGFSISPKLPDMFPPGMHNLHMLMKFLLLLQVPINISILLVHPFISQSSSVLTLLHKVLEILTQLFILFPYLSTMLLQCMEVLSDSCLPGKSVRYLTMTIEASREAFRKVIMKICCPVNSRRHGEGGSGGQSM
ncbi:hypothetical protein BDR07DRAFT_1424647 [Suillus spraguei]|nr:hypothetical protein BDR07DRAFT_1424647 [Suillus spraguei]